MLISISVTGGKEVVLNLTRFGQRAGDLRPVAKKLQTQFVGFEKRLFDKQGATGSEGAWRPIKPETIQRKALKGQDTRILHAELDLRNSLTRKSDPNAVLRISKDEIFMGTKDPKATFHQRAKDTKRRRKVIDHTERQRRAYARTIQRYIIESERA